MSEMSPCKGCTERHLACHDSCDMYKGWKERQDAQKQHFRENRNRWDRPWSPARERTLRRETKFSGYGRITGWK